ncbi:hypothetical protein UlMin_010739 [Ulmus minor]
MAGGSVKSNPAKASKRVEASKEPVGSSLVRGKDGSAFAKCDECNKDVPVALISFHCCSLDAKIKMNLASQVVEKPAEEKKPSERKKPTSTEPKAKRSKTEKKVKKEKDPNKPKRPQTAFFIFLEDFRKSFKEANPDSKDVKRVAKDAGEKWKSMTDEEKKPYQDKAAELKAAYQKALEANDDDAKDRDGEDEAGSEKEASEEEAKEEKEAAEEETKEVEEDEE